MKKIDVITSELDDADKAATTIKNTFDKVKSTLRSKAPSLTPKQEQNTRGVLGTVRVATHARVEHMEGLHEKAIDDVESYVLLEMAKIRSLSSRIRSSSLTPRCGVSRCTPLA